MDIEILPEKKVDVNDISTISLRDMYFRICQCRDFEISHVWQRAIFLTAFMLGCFTAYGTVLKSIAENHLPTSFALNFIALVISIVGVIVSLFWILMAKGSKAWYELYESTISAFVRGCPAGYGATDKMLIGNKWREFVKVAGAEEEIRNRNYFSTSGGAFSVSRINVAIGIIGFLIWVVIASIHLLLISRCEFLGAILKFMHKVSSHLFVTFPLLIIFIVFLMRSFLKWFKSDALSKPA